MSNLYDKAKDQQSLLQRIAGYIPGFGGYQSKELRRDADKLEREFIAKTLFAQKQWIKKTVDDLMGNGVYDGLAVYDKLLNKLDKLAQKVSNASQGYSGLFDTFKMDDAALQKLYEYDLGMVEATKAVEANAKELSTLGDDGAKASAKAKELSNYLDTIDDYFSKRAEYVTRGGQ